MFERLFTIEFVIIIITLSIIEYKLNGKLITPFTVSSWPFIVIFLVDNFILSYFGPFLITLRVQIFILINLILISIVGIFFGYYNRNFKREIDLNRKPFLEFQNFEFLLIAAAWIIILLNFNRAFSLANQFGGIKFLADQKFEDTMALGVIAHLIEFSKIIFIFLVFLYKYTKHKKIYIMTFTGLFFAIALQMVKHHLMWVVMMSFFIINITRSAKEQKKSLIKISMILFLIMNMYWIFLTILWGTFSFGNKGVWIFIISHFADYLLTSPMILEYWLNLPAIKPDWAIFTVFLNIKNFIFGNPSYINNVLISSSGYFYSFKNNIAGNVGTSFGVYYLFGGFSFTFFMTILVSMISYWIFYRSLKSDRYIYIFLNLLTLTLNSLNFFCQYFTLLTPYEMIIIFIILISFFKFINILKQYRCRQRRST